MGTFEQLQRQSSASSARATSTSSFLGSSRLITPSSVSSSEKASFDQQTRSPYGAGLRYSLTHIPIFSAERENHTGLPNKLKTGIENLSGISLHDVRVHYNSSKPARVKALAYTQGADIYLGPGQEIHLPHETWHVVQQKQGRVRPTMQVEEIKINDDLSLEDEAEEMGTRSVTSQPVGGSLNDFASILNRKSGGKNPYPLQRVGPELRAKTKAARFAPYDPQGRTRSSRTVRAVLNGANLPTPRRNLSANPFKQAADGTPLWGGQDRPGWGGADVAFLNIQPTQPGQKANGTPRLEYQCIINKQGGTAWLPRLQNADPGEDYATVGHKVQWRDYIIQHATTDQFAVPGGEILAISQEQAKTWYRDVNNLELQGQRYNSSIAKPYTSSDPPGQDWV